MNGYFSLIFCSHGDLKWGPGKGKWSNEYGVGYEFDFSLKWIRVEISFYRSHKDHEAESGE